MKEKKSLSIYYYNPTIAIIPNDENEIGLGQHSYPKVYFNRNVDNRLFSEIGRTIEWLYSYPALPFELDTTDNSDWQPFIKSLGAKSQKDYYTNTIALSLIKKGGFMKFHLYKSTGKYFINFDEPKEFTCPFEAEAMGQKVLELIELGKELNGIE